MPRTNSLSDSDGASLTSDESERRELREDAYMSGAAAGYGGVTTTVVPPSAGIPAQEHGFGHSLAKTMSRRTALSGRSRPRASASVRHDAGLTVHFAIEPKERFRNAVHRVIAMRRGASFLGGTIQRGVGAEPGVDPRRASADNMYKHLDKRCAIEVVDYSSIRSERREMNNEEFVDFMGIGTGQDGEDSPPARAPWVKVRWINIGGISWDVIKAASLRYQLHPLALEDVFNGHVRTGNRSKADYYTRHLFIRVMTHELADGDNDTQATNFSPGPRSTSPEPINANERDDGKSEDSSDSESSLKKHPKTAPILPYSNGDVTPRSQGPSNLGKLLASERKVKQERSERKELEKVTKTLKRDDKVDVHVNPLFIFFFRDGTIITINPTPNLHFTGPVSARLRHRDTMIRKSADPAMLIHALLDLTVDRALRVIDRYHVRINKFERDILLRPDMETVRRLHILSGELILHKRTLDPIKTLIYGLRRYDTDRCAALIDSSAPGSKDQPVVGFMTHKARIYLADVYDHMDYILTSLDMFANIGENLINYSFNIASYEMNEVMRRLTLATIIFLPLTILTGYFGMNFREMWSVNSNSDLFFWELAIPLLVLVIPIFLISDIKRLWHYMQKKREAQRVSREFADRRAKHKKIH